MFYYFFCKAGIVIELVVYIVILGIFVIFGKVWFFFIFSYKGVVWRSYFREGLYRVDGEFRWLKGNYFCLSFFFVLLWFYVLELGNIGDFNYF